MQIGYEGKVYTKIKTKNGIILNSTKNSGTLALFESLAWALYGKTDINTPKYISLVDSNDDVMLYYNIPISGISVIANNNDNTCTLRCSASIPSSALKNEVESSSTYNFKLLYKDDLTKLLATSDAIEIGNIPEGSSILVEWDLIIGNQNS